MSVQTIARLADVPTLPPQQREAEQCVLGAVLLDNQALLIAADQLAKEFFYSTAHQEIFSAMLELNAVNEPVDTVTLAEALRKAGKLEKAGGVSYLAELVNMVATSANVRHHAAMVQDAAYRRAIIRTGHHLVSQGHNPEVSLDTLVNDAEQHIFRVAQGQLGGSVHELPKVMTETLDLVQAMAKRGDEISGVATGFTGLDKLTAGWQASDLIILAARPSMGKTSLALAAAVHAAVETRVPVGIFSLEMSRVQLGLRLLSLRAHVNLHGLRTGYRLRPDEWQKLAMAAGELERAPMVIDDNGTLSMTQIRGKARRMKAERNIGLLIVDYLQLIDGSEKESQQQKIADISRSLKLLAKELDIPVVALSQLSRSCENRNDPRPQLSDLRDSGAIEQDADVVMFIYRDEVYHRDTEDRGVAEILVRKHRNGPIGEVRLAFLEQYATFGNLEEWQPQHGQ